MSKIKYITEDGMIYNTEEEAYSHIECLPLIDDVRCLLRSRSGFNVFTDEQIKLIATELVETDLAAVVNNMIMDDYKQSEAKRRQVAQSWLDSLKGPPEGDTK